MPVTTHLSAIRRRRGISAADLARHAGVSRQTIYSIEAGTFVPNTEVALKLARALEVPIEELFALSAESAPAAAPLRAPLLSDAAPSPGLPVQLARPAKTLVSIPVPAVPYFLSEADGVLTGKDKAMVLAPEENFSKRLVLAGCDPAIGLLARMVERHTGVQVVAAPASSRLALRWLSEGHVHIAGAHLKDARSGEFNVPVLRREYPREDFAIYTFARWDEGFVTAPGNPKKVTGAAGLARRGLRFVNRETGSGSRALLDSLLQDAGVPAGRISGYERIARGHLAAAYAVHAGEADCCLATRAAARTFGLDFVPLQSERFDLILHRRSLALPSVQSLLDTLQRATLRRKLEVLAGYDTAQTGAAVA